jgi:hypothetical protein
MWVRSAGDIFACAFSSACNFFATRESALRHQCVQVRTHRLRWNSRQKEIDECLIEVCGGPYLHSGQPKGGLETDCHQLGHLAYFCSVLLVDLDPRATRHHA